jgi:hypothetical protein
LGEEEKGERARERSMVLIIIEMVSHTPVLKNQTVLILAGKKIGGMW